MKEASEQLYHQSDSPLLDAEVLLAYILKSSRSWVLAHPEYFLNEDEMRKGETLLRRLEEGEALPYVLGSWEFYGLRFHVNQYTLIPRPETELLVDLAIDWLKRSEERLIVTDIGTGSGCIAISVAQHIPDVKILATDISFGALHVARQNVNDHHLSSRVFLLQANYLPPINKKFDLVMANLPYIPKDQLTDLAVSKREPLLALDGGINGLEPIRHLIQAVKPRMNMGGKILLEIEASQAEQVSALTRDYFSNAEIQSIKDLAGFDRVVSIQL